MVLNALIVLGILVGSCVLVGCFGGEKSSGCLPGLILGGIVCVFYFFGGPIFKFIWATIKWGIVVAIVGVVAYGLLVAKK